VARSVGHAPSCQRGNSPGRPSSLKNILYILIKTPAYRALLRASTPFASANRPGNTHGQPPRRACTLCPLVDTNAEGAYLPLLLLAFGCHRRETRSVYIGGSQVLTTAVRAIPGYLGGQGVTRYQ